MTFSFQTECPEPAAPHHDRWAQMKIPFIILTGVVTLLSGCFPSVIEKREPIQAASTSSEALELPQNGKILVAVYGNAREHGLKWVQEDASLAIIEDMFAVRPAEWAS